MRVVIAGGRTFKDYELLKRVCKTLLANCIDVTVICGLAEGADLLGERFAKEHNLKVEYYPAEWSEYGNRAGYIRNVKMAQTATHLIAFWNGKSQGTKHMIETATKLKLKVFIQKVSQ